MKHRRSPLCYLVTVFESGWSCTLRCWRQNDDFVGVMPFAQAPADVQAYLKQEARQQRQPTPETVPYRVAMNAPIVIEARPIYATE